MQTWENEELEMSEKKRIYRPGDEERPREGRENAQKFDKSKRLIGETKERTNERPRAPICFFCLFFVLVFSHILSLFSECPLLVRFLARLLTPIIIISHGSSTVVVAVSKKGNTFAKGGYLRLDKEIFDR